MIDIDTGLPIENKYDEPPNHGRILIDGIDISKVELKRLRSSVAIIPQDPTYIFKTYIIFIYS
jgi:ABC-type multidrug transport system fused ATPase/permease subunit